MNQRVAQSAFRGFDYAAASGRPLNTYVVLHLKAGPLEGVRAFAKVLHKFRDWLTYKGKRHGERVPPSYVVTFENPDNNMHVNWTVHIPPGMDDEFRHKLVRWVERVQGKPNPRDLHVQPVTPEYAKRLAKYVLKGIDPRYVQHFYLAEVHAPQGEVWGRRASVSQAIGIKARKRAGFHPGRRSYVPPPHGMHRKPARYDHQPARHDHQLAEVHPSE